MTRSHNPNRSPPERPIRTGHHGVRRGADLDTELKAAEIVAFFDGVQLHWHLDAKRFDMGAVFRSYCEGLRRDLAARDGS